MYLYTVFPTVSKRLMITTTKSGYLMDYVLESYAHLINAVALMLKAHYFPDCLLMFEICRVTCVDNDQNFLQVFVNGNRV